MCLWAPIGQRCGGGGAKGRKWIGQADADPFGLETSKYKAEFYFDGSDWYTVGSVQIFVLN